MALSLSLYYPAQNDLRCTLRNAIFFRATAGAVVSGPLSLVVAPVNGLSILLIQLLPFFCPERTIANGVGNLLCHKMSYFGAV
jgi:hypothetical protein